MYVRVVLGVYVSLSMANETGLARCSPASLWTLVHAKQNLTRIERVQGYHQENQGTFDDKQTIRK